MHYSVVEKNLDGIQRNRRPAELDMELTIKCLKFQTLSYIMILVEISTAKKLQARNVNIRYLHDKM